MDSATSEPPSSSPDSDATASPGAPAAHLVCAYSPRWLSGPTPPFDGLVATWSHGDDRNAGHAAEPR